MKGQCTNCGKVFNTACPSCNGALVNELAARDAAEIARLTAELDDLADRIAKIAPKTRPLNESGPYLEWWRIGLIATAIVNRR